MEKPLPTHPAPAAPRPGAHRRGGERLKAGSGSACLISPRLGTGSPGASTGTDLAAADGTALLPPSKGLGTGGGIEAAGEEDGCYRAFNPSGVVVRSSLVSQRVSGLSCVRQKQTPSWRPQSSAVPPGSLGGGSSARDIAH